MDYKLNSVWSLYILPQNKTLNGLTPRELQAVVAAYDQKNLGDLYVWTSTFFEWKSIKAFQELLEFKGLSVEDEPPLFDVIEKDKKSDTEKTFINLLTRNAADDLKNVDIQKGMIKDLSEISVESVNKKILPRKHERFSREYPVEIEINGNIFKTVTKDISTGGLMLKDELPGWVTGYFSVKIFQPNIGQTLAHTGWAIEGTPKRMNVAFLPFKEKDTEEKFLNWIQAAG